jgi:Tfp pilus assembly protein PilX
MKLIYQNSSNEQGSVLVVALLMLVLLTLLGVSATSTTDIETQIAGNYKFQKMAFFNADNGVPVSAKLISRAMDSQTEPTGFNSVQYVKADDSKASAGAAGDGTFLNAVMGYSNHAGNDVALTIGTNLTDLDVTRLRAENIAGGGVEFGAGSEGVGSGASAGGVAIFYDIDSTGNGPANSKSEIVANYRKVTSMSGGY